MSCLGCILGCLLFNNYTGSGEDSGGFQKVSKVNEDIRIQKKTKGIEKKIKAQKNQDRDDEIPPFESSGIDQLEIAGYMVYLMDNLGAKKKVALDVKSGSSETEVPEQGGEKASGSDGSGPEEGRYPGIQQLQQDTHISSSAQELHRS